MRLEGRTALVTGGAGGIGAATARRLAAEGARVAVGDLALDAAREVAAEIDGFATDLDVTDTASVGRAVAAVTDALGPVDLLVNNAGIDRFAYFVNSDEQHGAGEDAERERARGGAAHRGTIEHSRDAAGEGAPRRRDAMCAEQQSRALVAGNADQQLSIIGVGDVGREHCVIGRFLTQLVRLAGELPNKRIEPEKRSGNPRQQQLHPVHARDMGELMGDDRFGFA